MNHSPRGRADLHMHSSLGDGLNSVPEILEWVEHRTSLDIISITDHDDVRASLQARDLAAQRGYRFSVIPGMEVTTRRGHLLVYGVEEDLPALRSPEVTAYAVAERGGWCIAPHPMSAIARSLRASGLWSVHQAGVLLGVEVLNSSPAGRFGGVKTRRFNLEALGVAETGGSDAHKRELIGSAYTEFDGRDFEALLGSLHNGTTTAVGRYWTARESAIGATTVLGRAWFVVPARTFTRRRNERRSRVA